MNDRLKSIFGEVMRTARILFLFSLFFSVNVLAQASGIPSDVENLQVQALDQSVKLTWSPSTDDGIISEYKVYFGTSSVTEPDDVYASELVIDGDQSSFIVNNLLNDVKYYFAVTATDDMGNESVNYSTEVSALPGVQSNVDSSPEIISATHVAPSEVLVKMSKPVQVDSNVDAFLLTMGSNKEEVLIKSITPNSENITIIANDNLEVGAQYFVTATSGVTDFSGNPVSSGITDTIDFMAVSVFPKEKEVSAPLEEESIDTKEEPIIEEFIVPEESEDFDFLDTFLENPENPVVEEDLINQLQTEVESNIKPKEEDLSSAPDVQPPQDARSLMADTSMAQSARKVKVSWVKALDTDGDVADQILYTRVGLGRWDNGYSIGKDVTSSEIDVQLNQNYQVRLVTVDNSGNKSFGASFTFSTSLVSSGGGTMFALMGGALLLGMFLLFGRRQSA